MGARETYGPRVKTLATFECLGETFRVCWPRHSGKQWKRDEHSMDIVHGTHWVYSAFSPYHKMTTEAAIARFLQGAKHFRINHGERARDVMITEIAKMKAPKP